MSNVLRMTLNTKYVYKYNEKILDNLQNAFESGDKERLEKEWQKAEPILT